MLSINNASLEEMVHDAQRSFPDECCGFFYGKENEDNRMVEKVLVVNNAKDGDRRRRYEISPEDYMKAERLADEYGLQLLGVYHSHPNHPPIPSETDRLSAQPYFSYLILSVMEGQFESIRSWRLNEQEQFEEEQVIKKQIII
jgi:proteasome lid subunit RPN8/RPN11